jgi:thioredoxin-related protein
LHTCRSPSRCILNKTRRIINRATTNLQWNYSNLSDNIKRSLRKNTVAWYCKNIKKHLFLHKKIRNFFWDGFCARFEDEMIMEVSWNYSAEAITKGRREKIESQRTTLRRQFSFQSNNFVMSIFHDHVHRQ